MRSDKNNNGIRIGIFQWNCVERTTSHAWPLCGRLIWGSTEGNERINGGFVSKREQYRAS